MRDYVLLNVNGRRHEVRGAAAFRSLSDFLRESLRLTGTKIVCAEGDCGSCTVLLGRACGNQVEYRPITSCIQYVAQLDGAHVVTAEGLKYDEAPNPVQEAMVDHHGAQCGFCTPGMVVSLCSLFDAEPQPSQHAVCRALVGNLCRCTGYESILTAAAHVDDASLRKLSDLYPSASFIDELKSAACETLDLADGSRRLLKPGSLADALRLRAAHPEAVVLAGGTDLGVLWNKGRRAVAELLCIGEVPELRGITVDAGIWHVGAAATIAELERSAREVLPGYADLLERFGSPPVKNAGTVGGNIANGSPIGDTMPAFMVLDAEIELASVHGLRCVNINEFYAGYRRTVMRPDELIRSVIVSPPAVDELFGVYKISKRRDLDISSFTAAVWMRTAGSVVEEARIALGGVGPTILRLPRTETSLIGRPLTETVLRQAGRLACDEITPISDVRGSADYRRRLAENILVKFGREQAAATRAATNGRHP